MSRNESPDGSPDPEVLLETKTAYFVNKASGVLVHNSAYAGPAERSLRMDLGRLVERRVFPVHRLDRPTSGVILFAKEREFVSAWQEALASEDAHKEYIGVVIGEVDTSPRVIDHPVKDENGERTNAVTEITGGQHASDASCTLLRYRLHTGRKHQIRYHMKHLRHPLLGDTTYGKGRFNRPFREQYGLHRLALHASRLSLSAPESGDRLIVEAPVPEDLAAPFASLFPDLA